MERKAVIPAAALALGSRERVLGVRLRMQKDRKVAPDRTEALRLHRFRRCADDDIVVVRDGPAEQLVAYRAADAIDLHERNRLARRSPVVIEAYAPRTHVTKNAREASAPALRAELVVTAPCRGRREILRSDCLQRGRGDTENSRKRAVADAVLFHRSEIVAAHHWTGQQFQHARLQQRERRGRAAGSDACGRSAPHVGNQIAQAVDSPARTSA